MPSARNASRSMARFSSALAITRSGASASMRSRSGFFVPRTRVTSRSAGWVHQSVAPTSRCACVTAIDSVNDGTRLTIRIVPTLRSNSVADDNTAPNGGSTRTLCACRGEILRALRPLCGAVETLLHNAFRQIARLSSVCRLDAEVFRVLYEGTKCCHHLRRRGIHRGFPQPHKEAEVPAKKAAAGKATAKKASPAKKTVAKKTTAAKTTTARKVAAKKTVAKKVSAAKKTATKKTVAKKAPAKKATATKTVAKKAPAKKAAAKKTRAKKAPDKKVAAKKTAAKEAAAKKAVAKKTAAKKTAAKKTVAKKAPAKKAAAKKTVAKKAPAKKVAAKKA